MGKREARRTRFDCLLAPEAAEMIREERERTGESAGQIVDRAVLLLLGGVEVKVKGESRAAKRKRELASSDVVGQAVGRDDIEYGSEELPRGQHVIEGVTNPVMRKAMERDGAMAKWRATRRPLMKPGDR